MADDQQIIYDRDQLKQSGNGIVTAHADAQTHLKACQAQIDGYGEWWNPDKDPNDLIGGLLGACFTAVHQLMMSTGQQNLDALHSHGTTMQTMAGNMTDAEDANTGISASAEPV
jgi:hypothetical protein